MCEVEQNLLSENEKSLIKRGFETLSVDEAEIVFVSQLGRYGKSGARLLLCLLKKEKTAFVVKIHRAQKIAAEFDAIKSVQSYFPDLDSVVEPPCARRQGALVYRHQGARFKKRLRKYTELWRIAYDLDKNDGEITATFKKLWECFQHARDNIAIDPLKFGTQYQRYMRRDDAEPILAAVFGADRELDNLHFLDAEISNPLHLIGHSCFEQPRKGKKTCPWRLTR